MTTIFASRDAMLNPSMGVENSQGKKLNFVYGPMNSGKSMSIISTAYNYEERGLSVVVAKPGIDTKGDDMIVARAGAQRKVDMLIGPEENVQVQLNRYIGHNAIRPHVLITDESQFFTPTQVDQLWGIAKDDGISVIAHGLRTDFRGELFPGSKRLFEVADTLKELTTMCSCNQQARFNARKVDGEFVFSGDQVAIDGEGDVSYESICADCFRDEQQRAKARDLSRERIKAILGRDRSGAGV